MIRQMVESFKRLYSEGKIPKEELKKRLNNGKITQKEYDYIING